MIEIKLFKDAKLKGYTLLEGFPGAGLVGPMANSYIIEKLQMQYIGHIESDAFPPIAAVHDGMAMFPVRIYKDDKYRLIVIMSEFSIPATMIYELSQELLAFIRKQGIEKVVSIGGMPTLKPINAAYGIATTKELNDKIKSAKINMISEGVVAGVSAILLANGPEYNIPIVDLLVQVDPTIMDPKYAITAITNLKKIININVSTDELEKEAKVIEAKVRDIMKKARDSHESYKNATEAAGPSMYA
ncbi:MAG: proteasome assembly chaperone family protein [Candidatus Micrarchaeota archaeon]|nr:proteasome assembly chaperone family protein [Candidatus Micrarchaeota archaeon]